MADVRELVVKFLGDNSDLKKKSEGAMSALDGVAKAAKFATGAAVTLSAGLLVLAKHQATVGDALGKAAARFGATTEAMAALHYQAAQNDISAESFNTRLTFMQRNLVEAASGAEAQTAALSALNLKSSELIGLGADEQFKKIAAAIAEVENPAVRAAVATQLFGRGAADMLPLIMEGEEGLRRAADEADRFGLSISAIDAANLDAANDAIGKIGEAANGAARQFAAGLAPAVSSVIERLMQSVDVAGKFREAGVTLGRTIGEAMDFGVLALAQFDKAMLNTIGYIGLAVNTYEKFMGKDSSTSYAFLGEVDDKIAELDKKIAQYSAGSGKSFRDTVAAAESNTYGGAIAGGTKSSVRDEMLLKLLNPENANKATAAMKEFEKSAQRAMEKQIELNDRVADSFIDIKDSLLQGGDMLENFKRTALNVVNDIANSLIHLAFGGTSGGGFAGGIAEAIFGAFGGGGGGFLGGLFGGGGSSGWGLGAWAGSGTMASFAVGTPKVPRDMIAQIHKDEMIIPAREASAIRSGGSSGVTIVQNIQIGTGVGVAVRQEVAKLLPDLRRATIAGVSDAQLRGAI